MSDCQLSFKLCGTFARLLGQTNRISHYRPIERFPYRVTLNDIAEVELSAMAEFEILDPCVEGSMDIVGGLRLIPDWYSPDDMAGIPAYVSGYRSGW